MTVEELKALKAKMTLFTMAKGEGDAVFTFDDFHAVDTALERRIPAKPVSAGFIAPFAFTSCPVCSAELGDFQPFCVECGQRIDWPDEEDE